MGCGDGFGHTLGEEIGDDGGKKAPHRVADEVCAVDAARSLVVDGYGRGAAACIHEVEMRDGDLQRRRLLAGQPVLADDDLTIPETGAQMGVGVGREPYVSLSAEEPGALGDDGVHVSAGVEVSGGEDEVADARPSEIETGVDALGKGTQVLAEDGACGLGDLADTGVASFGQGAERGMQFVGWGVVRQAEGQKLGGGRCTGVIGVR
jgi:hypothetical protein